MDMSIAVAASSLAQPGARNPKSRTKADFGAALAAAAGSPTPQSRVASPLLAAKLILPTRQNVQQLVSALAQKLTARFGAAGIPQVPAVSFSVDGAGTIHVDGQRSDLAAIDRLVASDTELQQAIRDTNAVASHAYALENGGHLQFQRAYRLSSDPQEVVAQYGFLFGGRRASVATSISFAAGSAGVIAAGENWASS